MNTLLIIFIVSAILLFWVIPNSVWNMLLNLAIIAGLSYVVFWSGMFLLFME